MFYHILTSPVISNYTDPQQHGIYLFSQIKKQNVVSGDVIYALVLHYTIRENQSKYVYYSTYYKYI